MYTANLMRHYRDPAVLGVSYCACLYDQGGNTYEKNNQNGFYDLEGNPRVALIEAVTEINHTVYAYSPESATPQALELLDKELYDAWDKHLVGETLWAT